MFIAMSANFAYQSRTLSNSLELSRLNVTLFVVSMPFIYMRVLQLLKNLLTKVHMHAKMKNLIKSTLTANREMKLKLKIFVNVFTENAVSEEIDE